MTWCMNKIDNFPFSIDLVIQLFDAVETACNAFLSISNSMPVLDYPKARLHFFRVAILQLRFVRLFGNTKSWQFIHLLICQVP